MMPLEVNALRRSTDSLDRGSVVAERIEGRHCVDAKMQN